MSGVEIEFSADDGERGTQEEYGGTETETGRSPPPSTAATTRASRIQGQSARQTAGTRLLIRDDSSCADNAALGPRWSPKDPRQS